MKIKGIALWLAFALALAAFGPGTNFMSERGYKRWLEFRRTGVWLVWNQVKI